MSFAETTAADAILSRAAEADSRIRAVATVPETLAPDRPVATPIATLFERLVSGRADQASLRAAASGIEAIVEAQVECFPENIFWDYDYLVTCLVGAPEADETVERIVDLMRRFGGGTEIRFRYVHDFTYGFDWTKWVRKDPARRSDVGPFDVAFLEHMQQRADELVALIEEDDEKYPRLRDDDHRNPFEFSREPDAERRLHRALAREGAIPVEAWKPHATPRWDRDFVGLRDERAIELGL